MTVKRMTNERLQYLDANGLLASGYRLFFYAAGSSTKQNTFNSSTGAVANSNPIVLNALGEPAVEIWLTSGLSYKMGLAIPGSDDPPASFVWTEDNIAGVNDATSVTGSQWIASGLTPTYISATSFSLAGDQRTNFEAGRRLLTTNTGGAVYSTIQSSTFGAVTTVVVTNDSGTLDAGLSAVSYGFLTASNSAIPYLGFAPSGTLLDFAGTVVPTGWLWGDGSNFSRTGYASLFAAIGTTWGVGDGVTTAGLPDTRRRVAMGSGGSGTATIGNAVGNTGGEENHALTLGENGTHSHALSASSASGTFTGTPNGLDNTVGGGGANRLAEGNGAASGVSYTPAGTITVSLNSLTLANSGSGTGHNTIQPAYIVTKIIKV